jgi:hypothetical protein
MKLCELKEMAYRGGNLTSQADKFAARNEPILKNSEYIGDIDDFKVKFDGRFYSIWNKEEMTALIRTEKTDDYVKVDDLWVKNSFRGQKILAKLFWFLKSREKYGKLLIGNLHSDDTYEIIKSGGLSKFKRSWYDAKTKNKIDFDIKTVDDFYKVEKKSWSLMLESELDCEFLNMPKFNTVEAGYISQAYDWQIE